MLSLKFKALELPSLAVIFSFFFFAAIARFFGSCFLVYRLFGPAQDKVNLQRPFEAVLRRRIRSPRIETALLIVLNLHRPAVHDLVENEIDRREHLGAAAEVLLHRDELILVLRLRLFRIRIVLGLKEIRVSEAEAVDALLDIADGKTIVLAGNEVENRLLHAVRILVFIDHDDRVFFAQVTRRFRAQRLAGFALKVLFFRCGKLLRVGTEHGQGKMLQVIEVQDIALFLRRLQGFDETDGQIDIAPHGRAAFCNAGHDVFLSLGKVFIPCIREDFFRLVAALVKGLTNLRKIVAQLIVYFAAQHWLTPFSRQRGQIVPAARFFFQYGIAVSPLHRLQRFDAFLQVFDIRLPGSQQSLTFLVFCLGFRRLRIDTDQGTCLFIGADTALDFLPHGLRDGIRPWRLPETATICQIGKTVFLRAQPFLRERLTLAEIIELEHGFIDSLIAVVIAVVIGKFEKILPVFFLFFLFRHLIGCFEQVLQYIAAQQHHLLIAGQTELRVHIKGFNVLADDLLAERMKRADGRAGKQHELAFEPVPRFTVLGFNKFLLQGLVNAFAHFRGRGIRERHDEHFIDAALTREELRDDAVNEHARLARAGGRGHEDIFMPCRYCLLLIFCVLHR